jgi:hypothetical protein
VEHRLRNAANVDKMMREFEATEIVAHAKRRRQRGRHPSMGFLFYKVMNPREALELARKELRELEAESASKRQQ